MDTSQRVEGAHETMEIMTFPPRKTFSSSAAVMPLYPLPGCRATMEGAQARKIQCQVLPNSE